MVNASKMNLSALVAAKYGKSIKQSTQQCHQVTKGSTGLEAERVRPLGASRNVWSKKKLSAEKRREMYLLSN